MLVYPQLRSGTLSQFPAQRRRRTRTVVNRTADGRVVKYADPAGGATEWALPYTGLTDVEADALRAFFGETEGTLKGFTFLDPLGNLLAQSERLDHAVWERGPQLTVSKSGSVWQLVNGGAAAQALAQTVTGPGGYVYSVSAHVRSATAIPVTLVVGGAKAERTTGAEWRRISFAASGEAGAGTMTFGLEVPAGGSVEVYGIQAEPRGAASTYQASTAGGVYENAHFAEDALAITTTGENQHSVTVKIIHGNHF